MLVLLHAQLAGWSLLSWKPDLAMMPAWPCVKLLARMLVCRRMPPLLRRLQAPLLLLPLLVFLLLLLLSDWGCWPRMECHLLGVVPWLRYW
jgi:hypothetical protein